MITKKLPKILISILNKITEHKGTPFLVGGMVRDHFLKIDSKDYDIEVYGLNRLEELSLILKEFGDINIVGVSFGILKLKTDGIEIDFSFPRIENKDGIGHNGFEVKVDGNLSYKEASRRRDFTINSIGYNFKDNCFLDPFNGLDDLNNRVLKHIDDKTFIEDPLRLYRAVQFCARFNFKLDNCTKSLCKSMIHLSDFNSLSKERIFEEYRKLLLKSKKPSIGLELLNEFKLIQLDIKTLQSIDTISKYKRNDEKYNLVLMFYFISEILENISDDKRLKKDILLLKEFNIPKIYLPKVKNIISNEELISVKFDMLKNMPLPLVQGRDLIKLGHKPNKEFKIILDSLYKLQLDGKIASKKEAIEFIE